MKKKVPFLLAVSALFCGNLSAQTYQHLQVTSGYSADVIANGSGPAMASTSFAVDDADFNFMANDFQPTSAAPPAYALPANGLINSYVSSGLTFQLGPLSGNNSLRIPDSGNSGILAFSNGMQATKLYYLATTGSGDATITTTVHFTDGASQTDMGTFIPDWFYSSAQPIASAGFGRVNRTNDNIENPDDNPRLYQIAINILPVNQLKTVASVEFTKISSEQGIVNVFAVTAEVLGTCPSPGGLTAVSGAVDATISWTAPVLLPSGGYDYYYSSSSTPPTDSTPISGNVPVGTNSVNLTSLITGIPYFVWVRSNCGTTNHGSWQMAVFVTGQVSATYTSGDIPALYSEDEPTPSSATTCIGTLSVNIPVGYRVASVATTYVMSTQSNGWTSEQRSLLACPTTGNTEANVTAGTTNQGGSMPYTRTGLDIADNATGTVNFELRAWRTYQGWEAPLCGTTHNKVDNNTWTVTVTYEAINCTTPPNPVAAAQVLCPAATVADLVATGSTTTATLHWYSSATGGTELATTTSVTPGTYYVSQVIGGCESARVAVAVTTISVAQPTAIAQEYCAGATVADLEATGVSLNWYAAATGGTPLTNTALLSSGNYYVSQTIGSCESTRLSVAVTINTVPLPDVEEEAVGCYGITVEDATEGNEQFRVYQTATGGSALANSVLFQTGTYYVSQVIDGCESARVAIDVTIIDLDAPQFTADQIFCQGNTCAEVNVNYSNGADLHWYTTIGGEELPETTTLTDGMTYYVSQSMYECESSTTAITVSLNPTPAAPGGDDTQDFSSGDTVADLEITAATGATITWYVMTTSGLEPVTTSTALSDGAVYCATQTVNGCESAIFMIEANELLGVNSSVFGSLSVHPNPVKDILTVSNNEEITAITVTNLLGQKVMEDKMTGNELKVDTSGLPHGTYILQVFSGTRSASVKIIKY